MQNNYFIDKKNKEKIFKAIINSGWLFIDKITRILFGIIVGAWVARYLEPERYGQLAYVLTLLSFFQAVASLGLDGIVVRDLSSNKDIIGKILGTSFLLRLTTSFICYLIIVISTGLIYGIDSITFKLTAISGIILVIQSVDVIDLWFQSQSKSKNTVKIKLISYSISNILKIILIITKAPLIAFATIMTIEYLICSIGIGISYRFYSCNQKWVWCKNIAKKLIIESWPFIISGISVMLYMRIDQIMIKEMIGSEKLGIFSAIIPFATALNFFPVIIYTSFLPFISNLKKNNEYLYNKYLKIFICIYSFLGWLISFLILILSELIVKSFLNEQYYQGIEVLKIYGFTNLFICFGVSQGFWIINEKKSKITLYRTAFGAIFCILSNYYLIPKYGLNGAAITAVLSQFIATIFTNILFARNILKYQIIALLTFGLYGLFELKNDEKKFNTISSK